MTNDLISREALKKEIKDVFDLAIHNGDIMLMSKSGIVARILAYIDNAPAVEVDDLKNAIRTIRDVCKDNNDCNICPMNCNCNVSPDAWIV